MKNILLPLLIVLVTSTTHATKKAPGYIWFDLGNVLIDTRGGFDREKNCFRNTRYMPNALEYLQALRADGYKIGLITNIPESFGKPGDKESKLEELNSMIQRCWVDDVPFDLNDFDEILLPLKNAERKERSPKLFLTAKKISKGYRTTPVFQGETEEEIIMASDRVGILSYLVTFNESQTNYMPYHQLPR